MPSWWRLPDANPEAFLAIYDRYVDRVPAPLLHNLSTGKDANRAAAHAFGSSAATETAVVYGG
jgi:hypothetical protein